MNNIGSTIQNLIIAIWIIRKALVLDKMTLLQANCTYIYYVNISREPQTVT